MPWEESEPQAPEGAKIPAFSGKGVHVKNEIKHWYYEQDGERKGPTPEAELSTLIADGKLGYGSSVWREGLATWERLENTELRSHIAGPPPLTGSHVNNSIVWILAFAPLLGNLLEGFIAGFLAKGNQFLAMANMEDAKYWYVTLVLNIALGYWDEARLRKAGTDTSKFSGITWLVPVYLYQRSRHLHHNLAYFIVWVVCFAFILFA